MTDITKLVGLLLRQADIAEATGKTYWAKTMREAVITIESLAADAGRLDAIETCEVVVSNVAGSWCVRQAKSDGFKSHNWHAKKTLRAAIDAAMKEAGNA